jgi:hypothetical protein
MIGKPILLDHNAITDNVVGKITDAGTNDNGHSVWYKGWVKDNGHGLLEKVMDGRLSEVSIGAMSKKIVKENKDDDFVIPIDIICLELSFVSIPGVEGTSIIYKKDEKESLNKSLPIKTKTPYADKIYQEFLINKEKERRQTLLLLDVISNKSQEVKMENKTENVLLEMLKLAEKGIYFNSFSKEFWSGTPKECKDAIKTFVSNNKTRLGFTD